MVVMSANPLPNTKIKVNRLTQRILECFNATIIAEDCFEHEKQMKSEVIRRLETEGRVFKHKSIILGSIDNKKSGNSGRDDWYESN